MELEKYKSFQDRKIDEYINSHYSEELKPKIKFMSSGGKRLRGILSLIFLQINPNETHTTYEKELIEFAILIELLHCFSLVIDDTPLMDNDISRRGKESFFKKYGEQYTYYFIYYFITKILFQLRKIIQKKNDEVKLDGKNQQLNSLVKILDKLIDGQLLDINFHLDKSDNGKEQYKNIYSELESLSGIRISDYKRFVIMENIKLNCLKTSSLFNLAIDFSYQLGLDPIPIENNDLYNWSTLFGLIFQYSDDLLDIEQDRKNGKPNICHILEPSIVNTIIINGCKDLGDKLDKIDLFHNLNQEVIKIILNKIKSRVK